MTKTAIEPALTVAEWAYIDGRSDWLSGQADEIVGGVHSWWLADGVDGSVPRAHAVAALTLYGQPFGFTREDVKTLRLARSDLTMDVDQDVTLLKGLPDPIVVAECERTFAALDDIIARIEALLPSEERRDGQ